MGQTFEGELTGKGKKFALVVSRFNEFITNKLLSSAQDTLLRHDVAEKDLDVAWVPGSFEIPMVAKRLAESGKYDAVICLGAVIRGQTSHFDFVAGECAKGVAMVGMETGVPTIFGLITAETMEQAVDRAGARLGNRGGDAAMSAIEMTNLYGKLPGA